MNITIIIPFFNRENYLPMTLESIQNQSFKNFNVILVDDCSVDCSFDIVRSFQQRDDRFVIIKNTIKQRQGKAKNQAIDYVLWVNSNISNLDSSKFNVIGGGVY